MAEELEPSGLTDAQEKAAALDAVGESRPRIAKACGVTPKTISAWRKSELYITYRGMLRSELNDALEAKTNDVRLQLMNAGEMAIRRLVEALDAERDDGSPEYGTRARAAEVLLSKIQFAQDASSSGGGMAAAAAIYVQIGDGGADDMQIIEGKTTNG